MWATLAPRLALLAQSKSDFRKHEPPRLAKCDDAMEAPPLGLEPSRGDTTTGPAPIRTTAWVTRDNGGELGDRR